MKSSAVLYVFGTVISLIGTGFIIGVRLDPVFKILNSSS